MVSDNQPLPLNQRHDLVLDGIIYSYMDYIKAGDYLLDLLNANQHCALVHIFHFKN